VLRSVSQSRTLANEQGRNPGSEKTDSGSLTGKDEVRDQVKITCSLRYMMRV
jgi:hypothetical protein